MKNFTYLAGLLDTAQKRRFLLFSLLCLTVPAINLFSISMLVPVLEQALSRSADTRLLARIIGLALLLLLSGFIEFLWNRVSVFLTTELSQQWSVKIYDLYFMEDLEDHNKKTMMQAINGVRNDTSACVSVLTNSIKLAVDLLALTAYSAVLVFLTRWIGGATCLVVALLILLLYLGKRESIARYGERQRRLGIQANALVSTAYGSYKELKIDARKKNMIEKYRAASLECAQVQRGYTLITSLQGVLLQTAMQSGIFLLLAIVLAAGIDLQSILPQAAVYLTLLLRMLPQAKKIVLSLTDIQYASKYCAAFREDMERYARLKAREAEREKQRQKDITLNQGIFVQGLSFCYPNGKQIFQDASVEIPAGASVAVIGPSGEGKTTFLDLLLGLLRPQEGHILYDDFDIVEQRDQDGPCQGDVGRVVSYIPQTVYLNDETIRNNVIFMTESDGTGNEERIIQCLKCAQLWKDVREMPDGLDTLIGQNGRAISGGQRQRVALARALYKDFRLLVMDETTASLDLNTEREVIDAIRRTQKNKTLLIVTHHPSLASECERIYMIKDKKLVRVR